VEEQFDTAISEVCGFHAAAELFFDMNAGPLRTILIRLFSTRKESLFVGCQFLGRV